MSVIIRSFSRQFGVSCLPIFLLIVIYLAVPSAVLAQEAAPTLTAGQKIVAMMPMFAMVFLIFYFLVLRPQSRQISAHASLIKSLKKGEVVATSGGIIGKVSSLEQEFVLLDLGNNVKIKVESEHVKKRLTPANQAKDQ